MSETQQSTRFFEDLMAYIMQGTMIPKVQIERNIGPIIGFFLAEALSKRFEENIISLCPEFPIRKSRLDVPGNNQSTNIDWLMYSSDKKEIILLELKTADTSYKNEQVDIYRALQQCIGARQSASFLLDELEAISQASNEGGKYRNIQSTMCDAFGDNAAALQQELVNCKKARLIYLAPRVSRPDNWTNADDTVWLTFADLPETLDEHIYSEQWPILRKHLVKLDDSTRRLRNGEDSIENAFKNFKGVLRLEQLLELCRTSDEPIVIGLINWREKVSQMTFDELNSRSYKWDFAQEGTGKKVARNWITGDDFLRCVESVRPIALV